MNWELVVTIIGSFIGLFGAIYQLRQLNPRKRTRLKNDVEILDKLDKQSESYQILKSHIDESIKRIYINKGNKFRIYNIGDFIFGLIFILGFTVLSVYIYNKNNGFSWWLLLTANFAFAGFGGVLNGLDNKKVKKTNDKK